MAGWLLDTVAISELRKPHCDAGVRAWAAARRPDTLYLSVVTMAEIRFGIERLAAGDPFRHELQHWLERDLRAWFAHRILPVDEDTLLLWRRMVDEGRRRNHTFSQPDLFIAAQAHQHDLTVVTRNTADFDAAGVAVVNPWGR